MRPWQCLFRRRIGKISEEVQFVGLQRLLSFAMLFKPGKKLLVPVGRRQRLTPVFRNPLPHALVNSFRRIGLTNRAHGPWEQLPGTGAGVHQPPLGIFSPPFGLGRKLLAVNVEKPVELRTHPEKRHVRQLVFRIPPPTFEWTPANHTCSTICSTLGSALRRQIAG